MQFIDRIEEMARLDSLAGRKSGGLGVIYGRRRVGKTRLAVEWNRKHKGIYTVADQSAPEVQRSYLAEAIGEHFEGFSGAAYKDWRSFFRAFAREAKLGRIFS